MNRNRRLILTVAVSAAVLLALAGCASSGESVRRARLDDVRPPATATGGSGSATVVVAVGPAVRDTGLGDEIANSFGSTYPEYAVRVEGMTAEGALSAGRAGTADVVVVPDGPAVAAFVKGGYGVDSHPLMYDPDVVVGPTDDPAGVRSARSTAAAFAAIASRGTGLSQPGVVPVKFFSGGPQAPCTPAEQSLWRAAGVRPSGAWYSTVGDGDPGALLQAAARGQGYAIVDRATFLALGTSFKGLGILREAGKGIGDHYVVVTASGARDPKAAETFSSWLSGDPGRGLIKGAGSALSGTPFFDVGASTAGY